jgi:hypothetical protein
MQKGKWRQTRAFEALLKLLKRPEIPDQEFNRVIEVLKTLSSAAPKTASTRREDQITAWATWWEENKKSFEAQK